MNGAILWDEKAIVWSPVSKNECDEYKKRFQKVAADAASKPRL